MIVFDNIYCLYFFFVENKRLKYGAKHQATITLTIYFMIISGILDLIFQIGYSLIFYDKTIDYLSSFDKIIYSIKENRSLWLLVLSIIVFVFCIIRYDYNGTNIIQNVKMRKATMRLEKRSRLDTITIFTMILLPVLCGLLLSIKNSFTSVNI